MTKVVDKETEVMREASKMRQLGRGVRMEGRRRSSSSRIWKARRVMLRGLLDSCCLSHRRRWTRRSMGARSPHNRQATSWDCSWWPRYLGRTLCWR